MISMGYLFSIKDLVINRYYVNMAVNMADKAESYEIRKKYDDFNNLLEKQLDCLRKINHQLSYSTHHLEPLYKQEYEDIKPIIEEYKTIVADFETICSLRDRFFEKHPEPECTFVQSIVKEIYNHSFYLGPHEDAKLNYLDHLNRVVNH